MKYTLTPKTFLVEGDDETIYVPNLPKKINYITSNDVVCNCVYACEQFMTYPTDKWGRRIIPAGAKCPNVKSPVEGCTVPCRGRYFCLNGYMRFDIRGMREPYRVIHNAKER